MSEILNELNYWKEQLQVAIDSKNQSEISYCRKEIERLERLL